MWFENNLQSRRQVVKSIGATAGAMGLAGCGGGAGGAGDGGDGNQNARLGMGAQGSATFAFGTTVQKYIRENSDSLQISAQETAGSSENIRLVGAEEAQMEMACPTDFVYDWGVRGTHGFEEEPLDVTPLQGGVPPYLTEHYLVAVDGSGVETWEDLPGKNVWPLWSGASIRQLAEIVMSELGYWDQINKVDVDPSQLASVVNEGRIDVLNVYQVSGALSGWTQQLDAQSDLHHVEMSDEHYQQLENLGVPPAKRGEVTGWSNNDQLNGQTVPMWTNAGMVAYHPTTSEDVGYEFTRICHEYGQQISEDTGTVPDLSQPEMMVETILPDHPVHPGAAELFKEIGVWNDDWTIGEIQ